MLKKIIYSIARSAKGGSSSKEYSRLFSEGMPEQMKPALDFLRNGELDNDAKSVAKAAEDRRAEIAAGGEKKVPVWYSPKPDSAGNDTSSDARPKPGKVLEFTMKRVANTGKKERWATALYLIAREFKSTIGIELGACAGISAMYLSAAPTMEQFITVEGSEALADIARESLKYSKQAKVVNALFDDALDLELPALTQKVDLAYIDGHHEKVATIHYFNRLIPYLNPGAVVLFDDVSWSQDMRDAWNIISKRTEFSHAMDLGAIGVCIMKSNGEEQAKEPRYWDLQPFVGKHAIGNPPGWKG